MSTNRAGPLAVIVCDLDDTLYLERDYVASGFRSLDAHVTEKFGLRGFSTHAWGLFLAEARNDIFNQVLLHHGCRFTQDDVHAMVELYRHHSPNIRKLPDVDRFLARLPETIALALVTDGPVAAQSAKIKALGIEPRFRPMHITDGWGIGYRKPHPRAFRDIMDHYQTLPPSRFAYIADNPHKDFLAPKQLGWWTIRMRRPMGLHFAVSDLDSQLIDRTVADFSEIDAQHIEKGRCP